MIPGASNPVTRIFWGATCVCVCVCGSLYIYIYIYTHTYHVCIYILYIYRQTKSYTCDIMWQFSWYWYVFNYAVYTFLTYSFSCFWIFVRPLSHTQDVGQFAWPEAHALRCTKQLREGLRGELLCKPLIVGPEEPDVRDAEEHLRSTGPSTLIAGFKGEPRKGRRWCKWWVM